MAPLRGVALRAGPTRVVEILSSTAQSVGSYMRLYNVRTPYVSDTVSSGIGEKKPIRQSSVADTKLRMTEVNNTINNYQDTATVKTQRVTK